MAGMVKIDDSWVVDSGATEHITYKQDLLENKTRNPLEPSVTIPNGDLVSVDGKGNCTLQNRIKIEGVLHIPQFNCNLLSFSPLTRDLQCAITFLPYLCYMQDLHSKNLICAGDCKGGLYRMSLAAEKKSVMMTTVDVELWHKRLGHASESKLSQVDFLENHSRKLKERVCDSCVKLNILGFHLLLVQ